MRSCEFIKQINEFCSAGGTGVGSVATAPTGKNGDPNLGSLFGGSYSQKKSTKKKTRKAK